MPTTHGEVGITPAIPTGPWLRLEGDLPGDIGDSFDVTRVFETIYPEGHAR